MKEKSLRRRQLYRREVVKADHESKKIKTKDDGNDDVNHATTHLRNDSTASQPEHIQVKKPHNDYSQHFVDTGQRPQNFIRDSSIADRFNEYPKLKELIRLKDELVEKTASPAMYLKCDLRTIDLKTEIGGRFDVLLIDPPFDAELNSSSLSSSITSSMSTSEYSSPYYSWNDVLCLPIEEIAAQRSFVFLWIDESQGLNFGRQCFKKWGFRRCEDIVWLKTNNQSSHRKNNSSSSSHSQDLLFQRTKQHCLMGIKGTVRRSSDTDFINANVDIDLIIREECSDILPGTSRPSKPEELFSMIEHFCLGKRRLHLFARDSDIRNGWLSIGHELTNSNFNQQAYWSFFAQTGILTGTNERIEALRPKSPPAFKKTGSSKDQLQSKVRSLVTLPYLSHRHQNNRHPRQ